jgi:hypothetical protein
MQFLKILLVMGVIGVVCWIAGLMLDWFFSFRVRFWVYLISAGGSLGGIWAADKLIDAGQTAPANYHYLHQLLRASAPLRYISPMDGGGEGGGAQKEVRKDIWQERIAPHNGVHPACGGPWLAPNRRWLGGFLRRQEDSQLIRGRGLGRPLPAGDFRHVRGAGTRTLNVRYWPLADIVVCAAHVRFRG